MTVCGPVHAPTAVGQVSMHAPALRASSSAAAGGQGDACYLGVWSGKAATAALCFLEHSPLWGW